MSKNFRTIKLANCQTELYLKTSLAVGKLASFTVLYWRFFDSSFNTEAERKRGTESLTFLTGLTGLTRLENESLLRDKIILTQRGKGAEGQRRMKKTLCL